MERRCFSPQPAGESVAQEGVRRGGTGLSATRPGGGRDAEVVPHLLIGDLPIADEKAIAKVIHGSVLDFHSALPCIARTNRRAVGGLSDRSRRGFGILVEGPRGDKGRAIVSGTA
jgi:hypothetical protein